MQLQDEKKHELQYEKNQSFNPVNGYLHSLRYKHLLSTVRDFITKSPSPEKPITILEIGTGFGRSFALLDERFKIDYWGIEVNQARYEVTHQRYSQKDNFHLICGSAFDQDIFNNMPQPDLVIALETFEHMPGRDFVRFVEFLSDKIAPKLLICSVPVEIGPIIWIKNIGSFISGYSRHQEYSWPETFWAGLYQLDKLPTHGVDEGPIGHKGFDHRWMTQTIRHNFQILDIKKFPFSFFPAALSTSIFVIATPR